MTDYYTYEQWGKINYHVKKGEKSTSRNDEGVPLFSRKQVEKNIVEQEQYFNDEWEQEADEFFGTVYEFDRIGDKD